MGIDPETAAAARSGERRESPDEDPSSKPARDGSLVIRRARAGDLAALAALEEAAFSGDRVSRGSFRRFLRNDRAILHVAQSGGALAGYALTLMRRGSRKARLYSLAVARKARGQGIGARLLKASERAARAKGSTAMRLEVSTENDRAAALYRANGYEPYARVAAYYQDGTDAVRLEKPLSARSSARRVASRKGRYRA